MGTPARPDIYIGLVGAAGTDLQAVKDQLRAQFAAIGYGYERVKVSKLLEQFATEDLKKVAEDNRIRFLMDVGDSIRKAAECGDGVMSLVIKQLREKRNPDVHSDHMATGFRGSTVYIIDSLKNPAEISVLDSIYARNYFTIGVYTPEIERRKRLASLIARSRRENVSLVHEQSAAKIMAEDEGRRPARLSQDVLGTFPRADFFIRTDDDISRQLMRFTHLVFGDPFITPTQDEHFMNLARTASLRSCDLSRQVGAVIVDDRGAVISQGCNEVPYPGGGMYYEGRPASLDNRDHIENRDPNQAEISVVLNDLIGRLRSAGLMKDSNLDNERFTYELLSGDKQECLADSRIKGLIEFGRVVHAEMHAICEAARLGRQIDGAILYCTTFPCHGCTRHIIAAGIREVVFIEPYPKSLTKTLYKAEIKTDDTTSSLDGAVRFRPFEGVSPILYRRVFNFKPRKNSDGSKIEWESSLAVPPKAVNRVMDYPKETAMIEKLSVIRDRVSLPMLPEGGLSSEASLLE